MPTPDEAGEVLPNLPGFTDPHELTRYEQRMAAFRIGELAREPGRVAGAFDFPHLQRIHQYILQDVYPWAGSLRTAGQDTGAQGLGIPHCRPEFLQNELDRVFTAIAEHPPSQYNKDLAIATVAEHWGELTGVHPFRDGNSRTQRYFFTEYMSEAGWSIDWKNVDATAVHAARYVAFATTDSTYLAESLRPAVAASQHLTHPTVGADGAATVHGARRASEVFRRMIENKRNGRTAAQFFADPSAENPAQRAARLATRGAGRANPAQPSDPTPQTGTPSRPRQPRMDTQSPER